MKKLLIAVLVLVLLVGGVLGYAVMNAGAIVKRYKPDMERLASESTGSTVTLGAIGVDIFPSAKLVIDEVTVESEGETLTLANLTLQVALMPLLSRQLEIQTLEFDGPNITVYLEEDGIFIAGLPRTESTTEEVAVEASTESAPAEMPITVSLNNFEIRNGTITVHDRIADAEYAITNMNVQAALGLEENVARLAHLDGGVTLLDDVDVEFSGKDVTFSLVGGAIGIGEMNAEALGNRFTLAGRVDPEDTSQALNLSSDKLDLASLSPLYDVFAPGLNDLQIEGVAKTDLDLAWTPDGAYSASGTVTMTDGSWVVAEVPAHDVQGTLTINATEKGMSIGTDNTKGMLRDSSFTMIVVSSVDDMNAGVETLTINAFDGTAKLETEIQLEGDMPFTSSLDISGMQLEPAVAVLLPDTPMAITGVIQPATGTIEGTFNEDLMPSIKGQAKIAIVDGLIRDVNLGQRVLGSVTEIPFISGTLLNAVPESLRNFLEKEHTVLESVSGSFDIADETLTSDDMSIVSDFFTLEATGTIEFDTNVNLKSTIYFSKDFSAGMVGQVQQMSLLLDDQGRLVFPVNVSGIAPDLTVVPDVSQLVDRAIKGAVKQKAGDVIDDLTGVDTEKKEGGVKEKVKGLLKRFNRDN